MTDATLVGVVLCMFVDTALVLRAVRKWRRAEQQAEYYRARLSSAQCYIDRLERYTDAQEESAEFYEWEYLSLRAALPAAKRPPLVDYPVSHNRRPSR